jgi:hypothetical protein
LKTRREQICWYAGNEDARWMMSGKACAFCCSWETRLTE